MPGVILVAVVVFILLTGFRVAQQYERALVFRFGRYTGLRGPGLFWIIPLGVERALKVDMRVFTDGVEQQEAMTRDNVPVKANAVIWYRIVKPDLAIIEVQNVRNAVIQVALTTLRNIIGQHSLDDVLKEREKLAGFIKDRVDSMTEAWGVEIQNVEMKNVEIPASMQRAMAQEAEALREKRARIIKAEAEMDAAVKAARGGGRDHEDAGRARTAPHADAHRNRRRAEHDDGGDDAERIRLRRAGVVGEEIVQIKKARRGGSPRFLGCHKFTRRWSVRVMIPRVGGAQPVEAVAGNRVLPGKIFFNRQPVPPAGFLEADQSTLHGGDDFRLAPRDPAGGFGLGQIRQGEGAPVGSDHCVAVNSSITSHCPFSPFVFPRRLRKLRPHGLFPRELLHRQNCLTVGFRLCSNKTQIVATLASCGLRARWNGDKRREARRGP